jgi:hypothetical protein
MAAVVWHLGVTLFQATEVCKCLRFKKKKKVGNGSILRLTKGTKRLLVLFCFVLSGTEQMLYHLRHSTSPFSVGYFQDSFSQTICPGLALNQIFLFS